MRALLAGNRVPARRGEIPALDSQAYRRDDVAGTLRERARVEVIAGHGNDLGLAIRPADGIATSRAAMVSRAVEREMRRQAAIADAASLAIHGTGDDLDDLVEWTAANTSCED